MDMLKLTLNEVMRCRFNDSDSDSDKTKRGVIVGP